MIHIKHLISELERLTRLDDSLRDARAFILTLVAGVEHSLEHGQPLVAALWLQDKLAIVKELTTVGKFLSSDKFFGSKSSSWSGYPVQPPMLSPHFGDLGGTAALGAMAAFGGTSALGGFGGFGGSPAWSNGSQFQQGARNKGEHSDVLVDSMLIADRSSLSSLFFGGLSSIGGRRASGFSFVALSEYS